MSAIVSWLMTPSCSSRIVSTSLRRVSITAGFLARDRDREVKVLEVVSNPAAIKAMPYVGKCLIEVKTRIIAVLNLSCHLILV